MGERDLLSGLIRLHILHHAAHAPVFGLGLIEELGRHGYRLSPGTFYPILHGLEKGGFLHSRKELVAGRQRRLYEITDTGRAALAQGKVKVWELFRELFEDELRFTTQGRVESQRKGSTQSDGAGDAPP